MNHQPSVNSLANLSVPELLERQQRRCRPAVQQLVEAELPPEKAPPSTMKDLLKSIEEALAYIAGWPGDNNVAINSILMLIPCDNKEVADALDACGGEFTIRLKLEARSMISHVKASGVGAEVEDMPSPGLPGFSFGGRMGQ